MSSGPVGEYQVNITVSQQRIELALHQGGTTGGPPAFLLPTSGLSDFEAALVALSEYGSKLLNTDDIARIALVANLSFPVQSEKQAADVFFESSHVSPIGAAASDLVLTVNVRRKLHQPEIEINRICKWATGVSQTFTFSVAGGQPAPSMRLTFAGIFNIDVSTIFDPFARPQSPIKLSDRALILTELVNEVKSLKMYGYDRLATLG